MPRRAARVLITRPADDAHRWTLALRQRGIDAEPMPLIDIAPVADATALKAAWQALPDCNAIMFVSANAVQHFMAARPEHLALQPQAWGTGPGTQAALQAAGWPVHLIRCPAADADSFDSEALWSLVQPEVSGWFQGRVLIVRGADAQGQLAGRDWLALQLQAAGVEVAQCVAYIRRAPLPDERLRARAREALHDGSWWLFSSSEAAHNLDQWLPGEIGPDARALATHPRIAARLREQGWGRVERVPATLEGQVSSIESLP